MDSRLPVSSVHGILQARILGWVAMPSSRGSSQPRNQTCDPGIEPGSPVLQEDSFHWTSVRAKTFQSCPTLCDPMDCSLPSSSVHGILQARILGWVAVPSSRESSLPRDQTHISYFSWTGRQFLYHYHHLGSLSMCKPIFISGLAWWRRQ